jgi:hypothetical protein
LGVDRTNQPEPVTQPDLPGLQEACAGAGLREVPVGIADLTRKQRDFVLAFLRTGSSTEAAREAGYADPAPEGSKAMRHPKIAGILAQAALPIAKDADQLVKRAAQRSLALHHLFVEELNKPPTLLSTAGLLKLEQACNKADTLLGSLLGKIVGVAVSGEINHKHDLSGGTAIPESMLMPLSLMRRQMLECKAKEGAN